MSAPRLKQVAVVERLNVRFRTPCIPKDHKTEVKTTSGRKRLNIQGAPDPETFQFTFVEGKRSMLKPPGICSKRLGETTPRRPRFTSYVIRHTWTMHVTIMPRYLSQGLKSLERRLKLRFLPPYAPHLNASARLWTFMHKWITLNRHYATYDAFTATIFGFFEKCCLKVGQSSEILIRIIFG